MRALLSVIALNQLWVEANFKESQLKNLRIGQPVTLEADVYGKKVEYAGKIEGLGAGTGAAFALLPAQNATGNWIKVVQRVPVRIKLDEAELVEHPLRVGLSMDAKVDITRTDGAMLADGSRVSTATQTSVFYDNNSAADAEVRKIIAANGGGKAGTPAVAAGKTSNAAPVAAAANVSSAASVATIAGSNAAHPAPNLK